MSKRILFSIVIVILCFSRQVFAHPASKIELSYNQESKILHLEAIHRTNNNRNHFIFRISIKKNQEKPIYKRYVAQTNSASLVDDIGLELKEGDVVIVVVECNKGGKKEEILSITQSAAENK